LTVRKYEIALISIVEAGAIFCVLQHIPHNFSIRWTETSPDIFGYAPHIISIHVAVRRQTQKPSQFNPENSAKHYHFRGITKMVRKMRG
jgi:hypothetical protein